MESARSVSRGYTGLDLSTGTTDTTFSGCMGVDLRNIGTLREYNSSIKEKSTWSVYCNVARYRGAINQLDMIIKSFDTGVHNLEQKKSAEILSRVFSLKCKLSGFTAASAGTDLKILRVQPRFISEFYADAIEAKLGSCPPRLFQILCQDIVQLMSSQYEGYTVAQWARGLTAQFVVAVEGLDVAKIAAGKDGFLTAMVHRFRAVRQRYKENKILDWFVCGILRNVNRGKVAFLDFDSVLNAIMTEDGKLAWTSLGWAVMAWHNLQTIDMHYFGSGHEDWCYHEIASIILPHFTMELVDLESAMQEQVNNVDSVKIRMLALLSTASVPVFQFLAKLLIESSSFDKWLSA